MHDRIVIDRIASTWPALKTSALEEQIGKAELFVNFTLAVSWVVQRRGPAQARVPGQIPRLPH